MVNSITDIMINFSSILLEMRIIAIVGSSTTYGKGDTMAHREDTDAQKSSLYTKLVKATWL